MPRLSVAAPLVLNFVHWPAPSLFHLQKERDRPLACVTLKRFDSDCVQLLFPVSFFLLPFQIAARAGICNYIVQGLPSGRASIELARLG